MQVVGVGGVLVEGWRVGRVGERTSPLSLYRCPVTIPAWYKIWGWGDTLSCAAIA